MATKSYSHNYEILPKYMKYVIGENRNNLTQLYDKYPNVKFSKLYNNESGFHLSSPSLVTLENAKTDLYKLVINAENICEQMAIIKHTLKERQTRQYQYAAAERLRKSFEADLSLKITAPLECEVIVTNDNITKNIKNLKNPFALLDDV